MYSFANCQTQSHHMDTLRLRYDKRKVFISQTQSIHMSNEYLFVQPVIVPRIHKDKRQSVSD